MDIIAGRYVWLEILTLVTLGWLSLCQTATSCLNDVRKAAVSASVAKPSSPQSNSFTAKKHYNFFVKQCSYNVYIANKTMSKPRSDEGAH